MDSRIISRNVCTCFERILVVSKSVDEILSLGKVLVNTVENLLYFKSFICPFKLSKKRRFVTQYRKNLYRQ